MWLYFTLHPRFLAGLLHTLGALISGPALIALWADFRDKARERTPPSAQLRNCVRDLAAGSLRALTPRTVCLAQRVFRRKLRRRAVAAAAEEAQISQMDWAAAGKAAVAGAEEELPPLTPRGTTRASVLIKISTPGKETKVKNLALTPRPHAHAVGGVLFCPVSCGTTATPSRMTD